MSNYKYLIKVEGSANNNKYYEMTELDDGTFEAKYGRVGSNPQIKIYPSSKWDSVYKKKISKSKGYVDITESMATVKKDNSFKDIKDSTIAGIIGYLLNASNNSLSENYLVKSKSVTQKQVDDAQKILDKLFNFMVKGTKVTFINEKLQDLYTIIPRKMKKVKDHLIDGTELGLDSELEQAKELLVTEQDSLDNMASSVQINTATDELEGKIEEKTILDVLGVKIERVSIKEELMIVKMLGEIEHKYVNAIKITNVKSKKRFDTFVENADNKTTELLWHGSRSENWISILQKGLMIRPSNAVHTGSYFGDGIYWANKARKSYGYTSGSGSYWAKGTSNKAFMALFDVHIGKDYVLKHHTSECYKFSEKYLKNKGDYDSVYANGGADLRNDEKITYNSHQSTIKYLVELNSN